MRIAHVRERHAPAGAPWRLAAADPSSAAGRRPDPLDRPRAGPPARRRRPSRAGARQRPAPPAADDARRPARAPDCGSRRCATWSRASRPRADDDPALLDADDLAFGPPVLRPPSIRDFYAFEGHVRTMWERRGGEVPEAWYRLPIFYFCNVSEVRGPGRSGLGAARRRRSWTTSWRSRPSSTRRPSTSPTSDAEEAIGGYTIFDDWSARDLQRDETTVRLGPAKGKDFASSFGPWLVTPDELADARSRDRLRPRDDGRGERRRDQSRGRWSTRSSRSGTMVARASRGRPPATRRPHRQRDGRDRLPARGPRRDARPLPRARRRGHAPRSSASAR